MADLSRAQVTKIIQDAPPGVKGEDIINQLVANGHNLEGYTPESSTKPVAPAGLIEKLTTKNLDNAAPLDFLGQGARLGQFANKGNQDLSGIIAEGSGRAGEAMDRVIPGLGTNVKLGGIAAAGALGTASEAILPQNRLGVLSYLAEPLMRGYQAVAQEFPKQGYTKPGLAAQYLSAKSKVSAPDIQQAIGDPSVFTSGTVGEANQAYGKAAGPLQGAARSVEQLANSPIPGEADWKSLIEKPYRMLNGTLVDDAGNKVPLDPQSALEGVQGINRYMRNKANTKALDKTSLAGLLNTKEQLMQFLESNGSPGVREAAVNLRKAYTNENLGNFIPQNKSGGNDALRGMMMAGEMATAGSHAMSGNVLGAVPYALDAVTASPAFVGGAIRNYHSLSNPSVIGAAGAAVNAATSYVVKPASVLSDYYSRQR